MRIPENLVMLSIRPIALCLGLVATQAAASTAATSRTVEAYKDIQYEQPATLGERIVALTVGFAHSMGGRSGDCPAGLASANCWLIFTDELPARLLVNLWIQDALEGDSVSGRKAALPSPLQLELPTTAWWDGLSMRIECPEAPGAATPSISFVAPKVRSSRIVQHEPAVVECVVDGLSPGDWIISVEFDGPLLSTESQHLRSTPAVLSVRDGREDERAAWVKGCRDARRALAAGDYDAYEQFALHWLAKGVPAGGWELLAEASVGHVPMRTTAGYYARARKEEEQRFAGASSDAHTHDQASMRAWHEEKMASLWTLERLLPYLEADPALTFHAPDQSSGRGMEYSVSGPGLFLTFKAFDETVRAKLEAATHR